MLGSTVILATARTPFGKFGGALASLSATTLGGEAIRVAVLRAGIDPSDVDHVVMGNVIQAANGQAPARQALFKAGLAKTTTFETANKVCASGMIAVVAAARLIEAGEKRVAIGGGMESMSNAPYALPNARFGYRFGDGTLVDLMTFDALLDPFSGWTMAQAQTRVNADLGITREVQDAFAFRSHERASRAAADGRLADEIAPLRIATKAKGKLVADVPVDLAAPRIPTLAGDLPGERSFHEPPHELRAQTDRYHAYVTGDVPHVLVEHDEPVRADASLEAMAKLRPLDTGGTVTAGNAPGVNDGAAAVVLASDAYAREHGYEPLATLVDHADAAWDPAYLALTPAMAARVLLDRHGLRPSDVHVWEVNEAFAAVAWKTADVLGIDPGLVNLQGGAVAFGHPVGASGARLIGSVVYQLRRRGGGLGIAAICSGGGQGDAVLIRVQ